MKTNSIAVALRAKGPFDLFQRSRSIVRRYGFNPVRMEQALKQFSGVLRQFNCSATFPITAVTLKRHSDMIAKFLDENIEFAVHGYTHVDYGQLELESQINHLRLAREVFVRAGIALKGFRSPYLSRSDHLNEALESTGFSYVSNQPILWDVLDKSALQPLFRASYDRALSFYAPLLASVHLSLPRQVDHLIEIPVSLPDDEILIERLGGAENLIENSWCRILCQSHQRGELFTLQLHPERIALCADALSEVLAKVRTLTPAVWCARLDEIAAWWKARAGATIEVFEGEDEDWHCSVRGPIGTTVLARAVDVDAPSLPWSYGYREVKTISFNFKSSIRPFIGLSSSTSLDLAHFLRQQGYIVEIGRDSERYSCYFDHAYFDASQESAVLAQIEGSDRPLLRLGRWPNGAQSALAITGDIDALTLWDYGLRMIGR